MLKDVWASFKWEEASVHHDLLTCEITVIVILFKLKMKRRWTDGQNYPGQGSIHIIPAATYRMEGGWHM